MTAVEVGVSGLEAEHAETSLAMAEQALLPKLREAPEAVVLANGFSCRQQIREGSGHRPVHWRRRCGRRWRECGP
jgi:glycerol-3-phosphate dehydrogenase subunit C